MTIYVNHGGGLGWLPVAKMLGGSGTKWEIVRKAWINHSDGTWREFYRSGMFTAGQDSELSPNNFGFSRDNFGSVDSPTFEGGAELIAFLHTNFKLHPQAPDSFELTVSIDGDFPKAWLSEVFFSDENGPTTWNLSTLTEGLDWKYFGITQIFNASRWVFYQTPGNITMPVWITDPETEYLMDLQ